MNPTLLEQAVLNLADNAIKYSPPQSTVKLIHETKRREGSYNKPSRISAAAFEKPHLERIFERFYVVDKARSRKTSAETGLGLAIVKHIVNLHGGSVTVESAPSQGSTFTIHFADKIKTCTAKNLTQI